MTAPAASNSWRKSMLGKVHIGKKQLGWDDDTYRLVLQKLFNRDSASTLSLQQLDQLIGYMKALGWKEQKSWQRRPMAVVDTRETMAAGGNDEIVSKLHALWISLHNLGLVNDPKDSALLAFAQRQTKVGSLDRKGVRSLTWLKPAEAQRMIEALKDMARRRAGVVWDRLIDPRISVLEAQARRGVALGIFQMETQLAARSTKFFGRSDWARLAPDQLDALINILGTEIRAAMLKMATP